MELKMRRFVWIKRSETIRRVVVKSLVSHVVMGNISQQLEERLKAAAGSMLNEWCRVTTERSEGSAHWYAINWYRACESQKTTIMDDQRDCDDDVWQERAKEKGQQQIQRTEQRDQKKNAKGQRAVVGGAVQRDHTLQEEHDLFKMHKKVKYLVGRHRKPQNGILRGTYNEILLGVEENLKRKKEYVEELFNDDRPD